MSDRELSKEQKDQCAHFFSELKGDQPTQEQLQDLQSRTGLKSGDLFDYEMSLGQSDQDEKTDR